MMHILAKQEDIGSLVGEILPAFFGGEATGDG